MPEGSMTFHESLDLAYLPYMVSHLDFRACFSLKFRSILPSLPDDETLESGSFREISESSSDHQIRNVYILLIVRRSMKMR